MTMKKQHGLTLIELMVALTIGLLIVVVLSKIYMSSVSAQRAQSDQTQFNESARFAIDLFSREFRKAGFRNTWQATSTAKTFCSTQVDTPSSIGVAFLGKNDPASIDPSTADFTGGTQIAVANKSDVLRVRYYGEDTAGTEAMVDCQGIPVAANQFVEDTLYVALDASNNNEPTLYCHTTNPASTSANLPLVGGVESLQLLYGEDSDGNGIIDRYVPWPATPANTFVNNVSSLKISVVVRSPNAVTTDTAALPAFNHFSASYPAAGNSDSGAVFTAANDKRIRRMFSSEIAIRNFSYCP